MPFNQIFILLIRLTAPTMITNTVRDSPTWTLTWITADSGRYEWQMQLQSGTCIASRRQSYVLATH